MNPPTTAWHLPAREIEAYLAERVDAPIAASIEAHLLACARCRSALAERSDQRVTADSWASIEIAIDAQPSSLAERVGRRLGIADRDVRTLAPTLPQQASWLAASFVALLAAAAIARSSAGVEEVLARAVFLTLAPLGPLAAVAVALGAASEPGAEISLATPLSRLRVGAVRAATALTAALVVGLVASLVLPGPWVEAVAWLLPAFALSGLGALAGGRGASPNVTVASIATGWVVLVVVVARVADDRLAAFRPGPQLAYLIVAALAAALIAVRNDPFELRSNT